MFSDICVKLSDMARCFSAFQKQESLCLGLSGLICLMFYFYFLSLLLLQHNKTKRRRLNTAFTGTKHSFDVE